MRSILESPQIYVAFQRLVGGAHMRELCIRMLEPKPGERVLDIGCGPAYYLNDLPPVEYYGFDTNQRYIDRAKHKFGRKAQFFCEHFTAEQARTLGKFDGVMLMGLLHHLDDAYASGLLQLVASVLKPEGRVIALDTAVHDGQSWFERKFALGDRGEHVRRPEQFDALARRWFASVEGQLPPKSWVPSVHWIMTLKSPLEPAS